MHISINWSLNTSEVFHFFFMNAVVILCFLNKSSVIKNLDLSSVLPVDPVTYIMTNITFFWLKSAFIARHETRNFKLPWDIFGDYGNAETWVICFRWMLWYDAGANIKISHAGHANFMPGMPGMPNPNGFHDRHARHAKPDEQKLGMKYQPGERSGTKV